MARSQSNSREILINTQSKVADVLQLGDQGKDLLWKYGYDVGEGFVDGLSQYASLQILARDGQIRDLAKLLEELNRISRQSGMGESKKYLPKHS